MENKAFGIDLGTTYSCISYVDDISGEPVVVDNQEGTNVTPSVVYFEDEETYTVGDVAKQSALISPEKTCEFVKRKMGIDKVAFTIGDKECSPELISSLILKKLVHDAEEALDTKIKDVVITCPAYFGIAERTATKRAGELAGLNVMEIINEPTAAALCYGSLRGVEDKTILIYDLGGGTFDVTIIRVTPEEIVAIATDGDHQLGGKNWDKVLMDYLEDEFRSKKNFEDEFAPEDVQDLQLRTEKAKQQLTAKPKTKVIVSASGVKESIELTRETFDDITSTLLKKTIDKTNSAVEAAEAKGITHIDEIILVGGSCKMPQVKNAVEAAYPGIPIKMFEPNEAVAKGAALHAESLKRGNEELQKWKEWIEWIEKEIGQELKHEEDDDIDEIIKIIEGNDDIQEKLKEKAEEEGKDIETIKEMIGGKKSNKGTGRVLRNITSKSFGVQVLVEKVENGKVQYLEKISNLITKQDAVPATVTKKYATAFDNMENVEIIIYETDVTDQIYDIGTYEPLGRAVLELPPNLPEESPIEVTMDLSTDGLLKVRGYERSSDKECRTTLHSDAILTEEEVETQKQIAQGLILSD